MGSGEVFQIILSSAGVLLSMFVAFVATERKLNSQDRETTKEMNEIGREVSELKGALSAQYTEAVRGHDRLRSDVSKLQEDQKHAANNIAQQAIGVIETKSIRKLREELTELERRIDKCERVGHER